MWKPPFCPNAKCQHHTRHLLPYHRRRQSAAWFQYKGWRTTACAGRYHRCRCKSCGHYFCERTFHIDFRTHRTVRYQDLVADLCSRVSLRATHRNRGISPSVTRNRIGRLARNSIALHCAMRTFLDTPENFIADGFVSFETSQYYPSNLHIAIGENSEYLYTMDHVTIRRTGRMSKRQKLRQAQLEAVYKPDSRGLTRSFTRVMDTVAHQLDHWFPPGTQRPPRQPVLELVTDEKLEYEVAISSCPGMHRQMAQTNITWQRINSHHNRGPGGPMFAMDNFDRELRKDIGAYVRESVTFRRNVSNAMESNHVYRLYHNFFKEYRSRDRLGQRRWQRAGLPEKLVKSRLKTIYSRRAFYTHVQGMRPEEEWVWKRRLYTPGQLHQQLPRAYVLS